MACLTGPLSAILAGNFEGWCRQRRGLSVFWAPGVEVVLEVVRMAVNEKYPSLMPTLYPGGFGIEAVRHFGRHVVGF